jgi:hypothetical protein
MTVMNRLPGPKHGQVRRVVILGRGGAGRSTLAQDLSRRIGVPAAELDALFWRPGPNGPIPAEPAAWTAQQRELVQGSAWIIDGDLGPYDRDLGLRLHAADTVIVLDVGFLRCAWRTLRRGREQAEYWRWVCPTAAAASRSSSRPSRLARPTPPCTACAPQPWSAASCPKPARPNQLRPVAIRAGSGAALGEQLLGGGEDSLTRRKAIAGITLAGIRGGRSSSPFRPGRQGHRLTIPVDVSHLILTGVSNTPVK